MKRFLGAILTITMILALIPAVFAEDGEMKTETLSYVFSSASHPNAASLNSTDVALGNNIAAVSSPWGFVGSHTFSNSALNGDNMMFFTTFNNSATDGEKPGKMNPFDQSSNPIRVILLEIEVATAGTYNPSISYTKHDSGIIWEAHLEKQGNYTYANNTAYEHVKTALGGDTRLGKFDTCGTEGETGGAAFPTMELSEGKYYLWFIAVAESENTNYVKRSSNNAAVDGYNASYLYLNSFDLTVTPKKGAAANYDFSLDAFKSDIKGTETSLTCKRQSLGGAYGYDAIETNNSDCWLVYDTNNQAANPSADANGIQVPLNATSGSRFAFKLSVPYAGKYDVSIVPYQRNVNVNSGYIGGATNVYIQSTAPTLSSWTAPNENPITTVKHWTSDEATGIFEFAIAGDYYIVFDVDYDDADYLEHRGEMTVSRIYGNLKSITLTYMGETTVQTALNAAKAAMVDAGNDGETGTADTNGKINILTADISTKTGTLSDELSKNNAVLGEEYTFTAPTLSGKEFLYWARGLGMNKAGISEDENVTVKGENGVVYLTAVYRDVSSENVSVEFYNANGELWYRFDNTYSAGDAVALPDAPTMTGYSFTGWKLAGDGKNKLYTSEDTISASGKEMLFVAQYEETANDVSVTVNGEKKTYAYGEKVTVTANKRDTDGYKVFAYWQKKTSGGAEAEIVSFERIYTFRAYDGCEIEAVYREYATAAQTLRKILLSQSGSLNIAEFIGVDSAVEKGIIFGGESVAVDTASYKIKMTGDGNYLSAINNITSSAPIARAYAIFEDGEVLYSE